MCWPLERVLDLRKRRIRGLSFRLRGVAGPSRQWFTFKTVKERRRWHESLAALVGSEPPLEGAGRSTLEARDSALDPRVEPVLLLQGRPGARFQLLGLVEAKGKSKRSAGNGLAIRAAMMGADAVVDLHAERLAGFIRTEHRASGTAVRSVDQEGRLELKRRWFSGQIDHMRLPILAVAFLGLLGGLVAAFMYTLMFAALEPLSSDLWILGRNAAWIGFWAAIVTLLFSAGMVVSRWPQLVRPTALCLLATAVAYGLGMFNAFMTIPAIGLAVPATLSGVGPEWSLLLVYSGFAVIVVVGAFPFLLADFYYGRRAWIIDREFRNLAAEALRRESIPWPRRLIGWGALAVAIGCAGILVGWQLITAVGLSRETARGARTRLARPAERPRTRSAADLNGEAWRLATDADPAQRNPAEALRLAEEAVQARPSDGSMINTLGVAYYRAGKFAEAIETLDRSIEVRGFNAEDGFFLAMAHARLGRHDQARELYRRADQSLRDQHVSMDREPSRFREEAATVLEVAAGVVSKNDLKKSDPAGGQPNSKPAMPK
jgi:hypothetical protein